MCRQRPPALTNLLLVIGPSDNAPRRQPGSRSFAESDCGHVSTFCLFQCLNPTQTSFIDTAPRVRTRPVAASIFAVDTRVVSSVCSCTYL